MQDGLLDLDRQVSAALSRTGHLLQSLGHTVEETSPAFDYEPYLDAQITLWAAYTAQTVDDIARHTGRIPTLDTLQSTTLAMYELGRRLSAVDFIEAELRYNVTTRQVARLFETYDVLVTPTCTVTPMPIEDRARSRTPRAYLLAALASVGSQPRPALRLSSARTRASSSSVS